MAIAERTVSGRFEELVLDFLAHLELERGMSRNTLQSYRSDLLQFGAFLSKRGRDGGGRRARRRLGLPDRAGARQRRARRRHRHDPAQGRRACAPSTATCAARACATSDPTAKLTPPRSSRKLPRVLGRAEVQRLLEQPKGTRRRSRCATARCSS